jgi:hypothetical protein
MESHRAEGVQLCQQRHRCESRRAGPAELTVSQRPMDTRITPMPTHRHTSEAYTRSRHAESHKLESMRRTKTANFDLQQKAAHGGAESGLAGRTASAACIARRWSTARCR